ncbi:MAG: NAD-dependent epimerase/dehydratase family protein [Casimicrobium sp.]
MIAVTGASGYVGAHCVGELLRRDRHVIALSTQPANNTLRSHGDRLKWQYVGHRYTALDHGEWVKRFEGVETVIHCAARVHQTGADAEKQMRRDNTMLTQTVADAAREAGVRRFIYLSSAAVFGEDTNLPAHSVTALRKGGSAYAKSKIEAEDFLMHRPSKLGDDVHILRPPVVYGYGAPGNLSRLARIVAKGMPLPFGAIDNRRSIVSIRTLVNAIFWCVERPFGEAQLNVWHPTDRELISTTQIVNAISRGLKRPPKNLCVPPSVLRAGLIAAGQRRMAKQLLDSWELDSSALIEAGFEGATDSVRELQSLGRSLATQR